MASAMYCMEFSEEKAKQRFTIWGYNMLNHEVHTYVPEGVNEILNGDH
jgi:hypothetical protein